MAFNLVFESCEEARMSFNAAAAMLAMNPRWFFMLGDDPYYNTDLSYAGITAAKLTTTSTITDVQNRFHGMANKPGWREIFARRATGAMGISWAGGDDHRWADSCDHTVATAGTGGGPIFTPPASITQTMVNGVAAVWYAAHLGLGNTYWDRPSAAEMAAYDGDMPPAPAAAGFPMTPNQFIKIYHYVDFGLDGSYGGKHVRVIVPDFITTRSAVADADTAAKKMMQGVQEAWLIAAAKDAFNQGFQHIVFANSKKAYQGTSTGKYGSGENSDTLGQYTAWRNNVFGQLHAYGIRPIFISGDRHSPNVVQWGTADGATWDCFDICACPTGVQNNDTGQQDTPGQLWVTNSRGYFPTVPGYGGFYDPVFGALQFTDDGFVRASLMRGHLPEGASAPTERWGCRIAPRTNTPIYDTGRSAITTTVY